MDLKRRGESVCERRKPDVQQLLTSTEQQWTAVLQAARQAELRSLSEDFDTQSKRTESWIRERQQKLQAVSNHTPPEERARAAQVCICVLGQCFAFRATTASSVEPLFLFVKAILTSRPEGDCQVNNLRRRGQSLCDHQDSDKARGVQVQQTVRDTEELWRTVLQAARQLEASAGAEKAQEAERRRTEVRRTTKTRLISPVFPVFTVSCAGFGHFFFILYSCGNSTLISRTRLAGSNTFDSSWSLCAAKPNLRTESRQHR